jgi:hypothetical protein
LKIERILTSVQQLTFKRTEVRAPVTNITIDEQAKKL